MQVYLKAKTLPMRRIFWKGLRQSDDPETPRPCQCKNYDGIHSFISKEFNGCKKVLLTPFKPIQIGRDLPEWRCYAAAL